MYSLIREIVAGSVLAIISMVVSTTMASFECPGSEFPEIPYYMWPVRK